MSETRQRPFAQAAEENKQAILDALRPYLKGRVLEIGSGTGQHAVYFASQIAELHWQTSDLETCLGAIRAWIDDAGLDNLSPPLPLDVLGSWPAGLYDTVYTANTFHIMDDHAVARCIEACGACLQPQGHLAVYGPFNYHGDFTSDSNARFDAMLKSTGQGGGIKDFEWLDQLARQAGMVLEADIEMPKNNRSLVWKKRTL
jgi:cyclopropane fatty-acyl-phospholipid synthase-like methyltransferase